MPLPALAPPPTGAPERPLLVYLNIPFCNSKCHFCDWVAKVPVRDLRLTAETPQRRGYVESLQAQIDGHAEPLSEAGYRPRIMYWGGGTASILTLDEIQAIHGQLTRRMNLSGLHEATIEGSPESLDPKKLELLRSLGFNRISIGVQAFSDDRLRTIGRSHSADQAVEAVLDAAAAGFDNINIDLIVGFPDQPVEEVTRTVARAVQLPVNHFSVYPYRASPGTVLRKQVGRGQRNLDMLRQLACYEEAASVLLDAGHAQYAMSYFGTPRCQSDEAYYRLTMDWIGFGSGANSLLGGRYLNNDQGGLSRFTADPLAFDRDVPAASTPMAMYFLAQALTTTEGVGARLFEERTGASLRQTCEVSEVNAYLERMNEYGGLEVDAEGIRVRPENLARTFVGLSWIDLPTPTPEVGTAS
jgi:coproporphyrinogen III oxidase-like Fe-S oxidoreductase